MEVIFTSHGWDFSWASPELATGYRGLILDLVKETRDHVRFCHSKADKRLVVIGQYFWRGDEEIMRYARDDNAILVSPLPLKISEEGGVKIYTMDLLPPHKNPGIGAEANTPMEFVFAWCDLIDHAVEASLPEAIAVGE
jgi:hypothetical protein